MKKIRKTGLSIIIIAALMTQMAVTTTETEKAVARIPQENIYFVADGNAIARVNATQYQEAVSGASLNELVERDSLTVIEKLVIDQETLAQDEPCIPKR